MYDGALSRPTIALNAIAAGTDHASASATLNSPIPRMLIVIHWPLVQAIGQAGHQQAADDKADREQPFQQTVLELGRAERTDARTAGTARCQSHS